MLINKFFLPVVQASKEHLVQKRSIAFGVTCLLDQRWRDEKGLTKNPNSFGPLTNLPDYTFLDGRPTPLGSNQKKRMMKQREIAQKIVTFNEELQFAKERYARLKEEEKSKRQKILDNKFKEKGHLMLKE